MRHALAYPEAHEENPWGHRAMKVRRKAFVFLACEDSALSLSVKLPQSGGAALGLPFATPTGYGLGRSGWVTARFEATDPVPVALLREWIDESYRTIAPRKLVVSLDELRAAKPTRRAPRETTARSARKATAPPAREAPRRSTTKRRRRSE